MGLEPEVKQVRETYRASVQKEYCAVSRTTPSGVSHVVYEASADCD